MKELVGIFLGGAFGSLARYMMSQATQNLSGREFPWGILIVNVVGCFLMGFLSAMFAEKLNINPLWRITLLVGFLGGFTTFSGFTIDVINMLDQGMTLEAIFYIATSVFVCLIATFGGIFMGKNWNSLL